MGDPLTLAISGFSLAVSLVTAWLTLVRRGSVAMTQPTTVYFGPDSPDADQPTLKIYLRALLYCTATRGRILESMYVKIRRGEATQVFNIWVHGQEPLVRGSGLYVGPEGVACDHHFLLPEDGTRYVFLPGTYRVAIYATVVGNRNPVQLWEHHFQLTAEQAEAIRKKDSGVYLDWGPESSTYHPMIRGRPNRSRVADRLLESMLAARRELGTNGDEGTTEKS